MAANESGDAPTPAGRRPRRMSPHQRRKDLIRTALRIFSQRSPSEVTPEDIAEAAEVSRALLYRYFPNMTELRRAALQQAMSELIPRLAPQPDTPPLHQLRLAVLSFIEFADSYAPAYTALLHGGSVIATEETEAEIDVVRQHVRRLILRRTGITAPSRPLVLALRCWIACAETAVLIWLQERSMPPDRLADWLVRQLIAMVAASGADRAEVAVISGCTDR